jgi:hypothetical protein
MKTIGELQHEYLKRLLTGSSITIKQALYRIAVLDQYEAQRRLQLKGVS